MIESLVARSSSTFSSTSASCSSEFWQFWLNASKRHIIVSFTEPNVLTKFLAITLEKEKLFHCEVIYYISIFSRKFSPDGWKFSKYFDNRPPFRHIQAESWVPVLRNNPGLELPEIAEFFIFLWAIVCNVYFFGSTPTFLLYFTSMWAWKLSQSTGTMILKVLGTLETESQKPRQRVSNADRKVSANPESFCNKFIIGWRISGYFA